MDRSRSAIDAAGASLIPKTRPRAGDSGFRSFYAPLLLWLLTFGWLCGAEVPEDFLVIRTEVRVTANDSYHRELRFTDGYIYEIAASEDSFTFRGRAKQIIHFIEEDGWPWWWTESDSGEVMEISGGGSYSRSSFPRYSPPSVEERSWTYVLAPDYEPPNYVIGANLYGDDLSELSNVQPDFDVPAAIRVIGSDGLAAGGHAGGAGIYAAYGLAMPMFWEPIVLPTDSASYLLTRSYTTNSILHHEGEGESGEVTMSYECTIRILRNPGDITGRVLDESTGEPIVGALVRTPDQATVSGAGGIYRLEDVLSGTVLVTASAPGFLTVSREVEILPGRTNIVDFLLKPAGLAASTPIHVETFETAAEGGLPEGWTVWNFTATHIPIDNLNDPRSEAYKNWTVISRERVAAIGAAGIWDAPRRLGVKPGQYFNGIEVTALIDGKFYYAESDTRLGSQVQYLMSPIYNLSGRRHIYLAYHSIYEQGSNSIGAVEYSIDCGYTWLPVVYMLDEASIARHAGGELDVMRTLFTPRSDTARYADPVTGEQKGGYYGAFVGASSTYWPIFGAYLSARVADDAMESKRVEIFHLPEADNQPTVRLRFVQAGASSWYFGIDNVGLYSIPPLPLPVISGMSQSQLIRAGATVTLSVTASGEGLAYQWTRNGQPLGGETNATLTLNNLTVAHSGDYQVVVSNAGGEVVSEMAALSVYTGPNPPLPNDPPAGPDNWDFEGGLTGWTASGAAFDDQPTQGDNVTVKRIPLLKHQLQNRIGGDYWWNLGYPIGHHREHWIGTAENHPVGSAIPGTMIGEEATGSLVSKRFQIAHNYISFLVGGDEDIARLRVELLIETDAGAPGAFPLLARWHVVAAVHSGHGEESLRRAAWNVATYRGSQARIRIVDYSTAGHINVDDFRFQDEHPYQTRVAVGLGSTAATFQRGQHFFDWDAPVWGFADLHTHPMGHLGLGGKMLHAQPDGLISEALSHCKCSHALADVSWDDLLGPFNGHVLDSCFDVYRHLIIKMMDNKGPNPHGEGWSDEPWKRFRNWPVFSTITHQQMWHEWIRRAYDGGLRVMVALTVNTKLLARASKGHMPEDDHTIGIVQTEQMKAFADRHSDFLEIAYDPVQLRDIIRRNKLAIILGSELDDIGNFSGNPLVKDSPQTEAERVVSEALVREEIQRLYDSGIRYIFPVHLTDNPFGGTAVGSAMLNIANKYSNGRAFELEAAPASEDITFVMADLDFTAEVELAAVLAAAGMIAIPAAIVDPTFITLSSGILSALTMFPDVVGGLGVAAALMPVAIIAVGNEVLFNAIGPGPLPRSIWPMGNNFPEPPAITDGFKGHRNTRGLTPIGTFAVREMMRRGMMIDIDHMSHHMLTNVYAMATNVPGGYPLNSGHNGPRELAHERSENSRTAKEYQRIRELGGLAGVGVENGDFDSWTRSTLMQIASNVENDCAGTSKTFAQNYLYAYEKLNRQGIAFGTDLNGFIKAPGPRFGPQGAFGLGKEHISRRSGQIRSQTNGVLYTPRHARPLTTPAFLGLAVDPERDTDGEARRFSGYEYTQDQADFFAALSIFLGLAVKPTANINDLAATIHEIAEALSDNYPTKRRVKDYAFGLAKGVTGHKPQGADFSPDTGPRQQLGKAVYRYKAGNEPAPQEIRNHSALWFRFNQHCKVWDDYHKIFGGNAPMKRCETAGKQWDINFEGVAHYGLLPDFLQDLSNVGLHAREMSALFASAEHFARMWTKSLQGAAAFATPRMQILTPQPGTDSMTVEWFPDEQDVLETTDNLGDPTSWRPATNAVVEENGRKRSTLRIDREGSARYFRVRRIAP